MIHDFFSHELGTLLHVVINSIGFLHVVLTPLSLLVLMKDNG